MQAFGASAVYLFGSILREDFGRHSDVDIAVSGLPEDRLYTVEGYVEEILCTDRFDLVYMEEADPLLAERILKTGVKIC